MPYYHPLHRYEHFTVRIRFTYLLTYSMVQSPS